MNKFIKLTDVGGKTFLVNINKIVCTGNGTYYGETMTEITIRNTNSSYMQKYAKETSDEILSLIKSSNEEKL